MYMLAQLRALLIIDPLIVFCTVAYGLVNLVVSLFETTGRMQVSIARAWARMLLRVSFVSMKVEGLEKIDPKGSYVFVANHLSYMDTPCILAAIPVQFRFMAKKGLFKIPFLGYHLSRAGHIAVPRDNPREAIKAMAEAGKIVRERGISILIFPEGGRSPNAKLHRDQRRCARGARGDLRQREGFTLRLRYGIAWQRAHEDRRAGLNSGHDHQGARSAGVEDARRGLRVAERYRLGGRKG